MTIKMLVFDYRDSEKNFFGTHELENFEITFYNDSLTEETIKFLPEELLDSTSVISVFANSQVTKNVIKAFKNLRIISTRSMGIDHIDKISAGVKVGIGGHGDNEQKGDEQFEISDPRSVDEVRRSLFDKGLQPVFTDYVRV